MQIQAKNFLSTKYSKTQLISEFVWLSVSSQFHHLLLEFWTWPLCSHLPNGPKAGSAVGNKWLVPDSSATSSHVAGRGASDVSQTQCSV